jgi:hypothetical protein
MGRIAVANQRDTAVDHAVGVDAHIAVLLRVPDLDTGGLVVVRVGQPVREGRLRIAPSTRQVDVVVQVVQVGQYQLAGGAVVQRVAIESARAVHIRQHGAKGRVIDEMPLRVVEVVAPLVEGAAAERAVNCAVVDRAHHRVGQLARRVGGGVPLARRLVAARQDDSPLRAGTQLLVRRGVNRAVDYGRSARAVAELEVAVGARIAVHHQLLVAEAVHPAVVVHEVGVVEHG